MDRNISLAVLQGRTIRDGKYIVTTKDWQRPLGVALGIWARFISPRQLEETALALRIRHAVLSWFGPVYLECLSSPDPHSRKHKRLGYIKETQGSDESESNPCYTHSPLNSSRDIRLLQIQPGPKGSIVHCNLIVDSLDNPRNFVALSYTWGDSKQSHEICCNGHDFTVTTNLYEALQYLRSPTKTLTFWIDAICIDQKNLQERRAQVKLMGELYNKASQAYVWLGLEGENSARGVSLIHTICSVSRSFKGDKMSFTDLTEAGIPPVEDDDWKALESIFRRAWWSRMWIIQEICVSRKGLFMCGLATIDAEDLFEATTFIELSAISATTGIDTGSAKYLSNLRQTRVTGGDLGLLHLLVDTRGFAVSNFRDKIYALLGMCPTSEAQAIVPSYEKPYQDIYHSLAMTFLEQGSLDILTSVSDPYWRDLSFGPSWVPDWSLVPQVTEFLRPSNPISASASSKSYADVRFSSDRTTLLARGALIDTVVETHKPYLFESMYERRAKGDKIMTFLPDNWIETLGGETLIRMGIRILCWERAAMTLDTYSSEDSLIAFLRTITANTITHLDLKALYKSFCMVQLFIRPDRVMDMTDLKNSCVFSKAFFRASWGENYVHHEARLSRPRTVLDTFR